MSWGAERLTRFDSRMHAELKAIDPALDVRWAPGMFCWSRQAYLQNWPAWITAGAADCVIPQVSRYDLDAYRRTLLTQSGDSPGLKARGERLFPGMLISLGEYRIFGDDLIEAITLNREKGFHGEALFFSEGLRSDNDRLATLLHSPVYARHATIPLPLRSRHGRPSAEG